MDYFKVYREMLSLRGLTDHTVKSYSTYIALIWITFRLSSANSQKTFPGRNSGSISAGCRRSVPSPTVP